MMKNKRKNILTYILLTVSLLVLMVTVFPHHHHGQHLCPIILCENCHTWGCSSEHDNSQSTGHEGDDQSCDATCVTHFHYLTPVDAHHNTDADYSFFTLIYPLLSQLEILTQVDDSSDSEQLYLEKLHARLFNASTGWRAPPFMVLA